MEDPCQGEALLESDETIQPMHDGEALHHHQTELTTLNKRIELYMPAPTKVHSKILLTDRISFSQRAHMLALKTLTFIYRANVSKVRKIFRTCND